MAEAAWPYVAAAFALFLSGKPILDGLEAWPKLYEKIRPFRRHKPTFNREAASIVAVHETASKLGAEPRSLRLIAYSTGDRTGGPYDLDALSEIGEAPRDDRLGAFAHLFRIEFNGQTFNVTVEGNMVTVIEVT